MSSKVTLSLVAPFLCALVVAQNASAQAYSADDLVRTAIERNRELQATQQRVVEARGLLRQAGIRPGPSLQFEGATGRPLGSPGEEEYAAGYSQPLEMAGKREKRVRVAEKGVALAEAELGERTRRLVIDVKLRYVDAVTEQARLATLDRLIGTYKESAKLTQARIEQGDAAPLDGQLLLVELNRAEAQRRTVMGRVSVALADLRRLCGFGISESVNLSVDSASAPSRKYPLAELVLSALAQRQDLRVARIVEEQAAAEVNLTEAQPVPRRSDSDGTIFPEKRAIQRAVWIDGLGPTGGPARQGQHPLIWSLVPSPLQKAKPRQHRGSGGPGDRLQVFEAASGGNDPARSAGSVGALGRLYPVAPHPEQWCSPAIREEY